ncbi:FMN reductase, partial [Rhizobium johnstonii]
MSAPKLVGLAGSFNRPSKTFELVENVAGLAAEKYGFDKTIYDLTDVGPSLGQALRRGDLDSRA